MHFLRFNVFGALPRQPNTEKPHSERLYKLNCGAKVRAERAPKLFPMPAHLADRMVDLAQLEAGESILEPHGGKAAFVQRSPGR
jgi:hypothetical protein